MHHAILTLANHHSGKRHKTRRTFSQTLLNSFWRHKIVNLILNDRLGKVHKLCRSTADSYTKRLRRVDESLTMKSASDLKHMKLMLPVNQNDFSLARASALQGSISNLRSPNFTRKQNQFMKCDNQGTKLYVSQSHIKLQAHHEVCQSTQPMMRLGDVLTLEQGNDSGTALN